MQLNIMFTTLMHQTHETPKELRKSLKDMYEKWTIPEKTKEQIGDVVVL